MPGDSCPVGEVRRDDQLTAAPDLHPDHALRPSPGMTVPRPGRTGTAGRGSTTSRRSAWRSRPRRRTGRVTVSPGLGGRPRAHDQVLDLELGRGGARRDGDRRLGADGAGGATGPAIGRRDRRRSCGGTPWWGRRPPWWWSSWPTSSHRRRVPGSVAARATRVQVRRRVMEVVPFDGSGAGRRPGGPGPDGSRPLAGPGVGPPDGADGPPAAPTHPLPQWSMLLDRLARVTDQLRSSVAELEPETAVSGIRHAARLLGRVRRDRTAGVGRQAPGSARRVESSNVWRRCRAPVGGGPRGRGDGTRVSDPPSPRWRPPATWAPCRPPTRRPAGGSCPRPR